MPALIVLIIHNCKWKIAIDSVYVSPLIIRQIHTDKKNRLRKFSRSPKPEPLTYLKEQQMVHFLPL